MRPRSPVLLHRVIAVAAAIGFALPASVALAQAGQAASPNAAPGAGPGDSQNVSPNGTPESEAATAKPASVGGVIVQAPRPEPEAQIPADKRAAYDAEVAKSDAWKRYRKSIPSTNVGTLEQSDDYPGLQSLLPPP